MASVFKGLVTAVARQRALDKPSEQLAQAVAKVYQGERGARVADALHGVWFGHALHPALIAVPLGGWTTTLALDALGLLTRSRRWQAGADASLALGVIGALPAALTGVTDWYHTRGETRRIGFAHAALNDVALTLYGLSWLARRRGDRGRGGILALLGYGVVMGGAYLGGELPYDRHVGVNHAHGQEPPSQWQAVLPASELRAGSPRRVEVEGVAVVLVRQGEQLHALAATCAHLGGPLDQGTLEDGGIVCPWHGSCFELASGDIRRGPSVYPQPRFGVRVREGQIELGPPGEEGQQLARSMNGHREPAGAGRT